MTTPNPMLAELDAVVRLSDKAAEQPFAYGDTSHIKAYDFIRTHHATLADMAKRLEALQSLAAAMYQAAGAYDMPVRFLDVLSAAGNGEPITEEQVDALLPCETPDTLQRLEAAERDSKRLDWLEGQREAYGFENCHEGNRWVIDGPFATVRQAIDATQEGEG